MNWKSILFAVGVAAIKELVTQFVAKSGADTAAKSAVDTHAATT